MSRHRKEPPDRGKIELTSALPYLVPIAGILVEEVVQTQSTYAVAAAQVLVRVLVLLCARKLAK